MTQTGNFPGSENVVTTEPEIVDSQEITPIVEGHRQDSELEPSIDRLVDREDGPPEELEFTMDHFAEDSTFPYEMETEDTSTLGCTPMGRGRNLPTTSTANRDAPDTLSRRVSARSTKGKPPEKLSL